jgi:catalase-peroxidase
MDEKVGPGGGCPMQHDNARSLLGRTNKDWWPEMLATEILNPNGPSNPLGADFDYAAAFLALDYTALKADLLALMTDSQPWWPADYGHYGGFFIRMAWHSGRHLPHSPMAAAARAAGSSASPRSTAGPTTATSTRRAACCGRSSRSTARSISWADLMILAGNVALESMGFKTFGFGGGRADIWEPERDIYWGSEAEWQPGRAERYSGDRELSSKARWPRCRWA